VASWVEMLLLSRRAKRTLPELTSLKRLFFKIGVPASLAFLLAALLKFLSGSLPALLIAPLIIGISGLFYTLIAFRSGVEESHLVLRPVRRILYRR